MKKKKELPLRVDVHLVIALTLKIACGLYMIVNISSVDLFKALIISLYNVVAISLSSTENEYGRRSSLF